MKKEIFIVEQGSVLPNTDDEYEYYLLEFQEGKFSLYDEDYAVFLSLQEALVYAHDCARDWDEYNSAYCLIHSSIENLSDNQIKSIINDGDYGTFINPSDDSIIYFAYKNNKNIVMVRDKRKGAIMKEIREKVIEMMENNPILTRLENDKWYSVEDAIVSLICEITRVADTTYDKSNLYGLSPLDKKLKELEPTSFEEQIYRKTRDFYYYEDLKTVLDDNEEGFTPEQIEQIHQNADTIVEKYDDYIDYDWRVALVDAINDTIFGGC